jgi:DNA-binding response OmpR family regulator
VYAILCVSQEPTTLQTLTLALRSRGYICISAESADEAQGAFAGSGADLVLLDHALPGSEKLAQSLKAQRNVPLIMLAGLSDILPPMGYVDLLCPKPVNGHEVLREVDSFLGGKRKVSAER